MKSILAVLLAVLGSSCAVRPEKATATINTIAGNPRFPSGEIEAFIPAADWQDIRHRKILRYAIFEADIKTDGSVTVGKVLEARPDSTWNEIARTFGKNVVLRTRNDFGTMVNARGEIYCIFFKPAGTSGNNYVVIYGQANPHEVKPPGGPLVFIGRVIAEPEGGSTRPKYFEMKLY